MYALHVLLRVMFMVHAWGMSWWWWYMIWYTFVMIWYIVRSISWLPWYLVWYMSWWCYHMLEAHIMVLSWGTSLMISYGTWCMSWLRHIMSDMVYGWGTWFEDHLGYYAHCLRYIFDICMRNSLVKLMSGEIHSWLIIWC